MTYPNNSPTSSDYDGPWDEEWAPLDGGYVANARGQGTIILIVQAADSKTMKARTEFASAAPDLVRAFLAGGDWIRGAWHYGRECRSGPDHSACSERCATVRAALTKAGVPTHREWPSGVPIPSTAAKCCPESRGA